MTKQVIQSEFAPRPRGYYSQGWAVTGGKIIFLSGQVPIDLNGELVGKGDVVLQTTTVFENLKNLLEAAGGGLRDVIKLNTYVTNIAEYRQKTRELRKKYFPQDFPASTLVEVRSLTDPDFMVEIEAVAAIG
jgi:2-iminobutanoate/2-iminopropanoate deaminase